MLGVNTDSFALLVHRNSDSGKIEVTSHKVIPAPESGFTLGAGRLFRQQDKENMLDLLADTKSSIQYIAPKVLARDSSGCSMVWYTEPQLAEVNFKGASYRVPLPMLVYAKHEGASLRVYAAKGKKRPEPSTPLFVAPLGNINLNGTMCGGNARLTTFQGDGQIEAYEGFAISATATHFGDTHPAKGVQNMEQFESLMASLQESNARSFPANLLLPVKLASQGNRAFTLADLIALGVK